MLKWIAGGFAALAAVGGVTFAVVTRKERGTETMPDGLIVAWEIRRSWSAWVVSIAEGAAAFASIGSEYPTRMLAREALAQRMEEIRRQHLRIGQSSSVRKPGDLR